MIPGRSTPVEVKLNDVAYAFQKGHRIRIAISTAYWPMIWPAPVPVTLTVQTRGSRLDLPLRVVEPAGELAVSFDLPEQAATSEKMVLRAGNWQNTVHRDIKTGRISVKATRDDGLTRLASNGLEIGSRVDEDVSVTVGDPLSASTTMTRTYFIGRGTWRTRIDVHTHVTCSLADFNIEASLSAFENDDLVFENRWEKTIRRNGL